MGLGKALAAAEEPRVSVTAEFFNTKRTDANSYRYCTNTC